MVTFWEFCAMGSVQGLGKHFKVEVQQCTLARSVHSQNISPIVGPESGGGQARFVLSSDLCRAVGASPLPAPQHPLHPGEGECFTAANALCLN